MIVVMVAALVLPTMAQSSQEWQSTSSMPGSGSTYRSQVTSVGASAVSEMATTTSSEASRVSGAHKAPPVIFQPEVLETGSTPIGDALIPLALMAMLFAGGVYFRRKRADVG